MAREFSEFSGSLPDSSDDFHVAADGTLRLINFDVNVSALKIQHRKVIADKLTPFLLAATKALGPGDYKLRCVGTASATGSFQNNARLSDERALNAARFAIETFQKQAPANPHVSTCKLTADPKPAADTAAQQDVRDRHISHHEIERKQPHFRAAQFILSAGKVHPKGSEIFEVREIYLFKFKSRSEPLPVVLERLKQVVAGRGLISTLAGKIRRVRVILERIEAFTKLVETALGPEGKLAMIILTFMVPEEIDACYEVKNSESNHGLYRFNGTGNRVSAGLLDLLGLVSEAIEAMKGVVKALKTVLGLPKGAEKAIQFIEKFIKDLHADTVEVARNFGPGLADVVDVMLTMMENGVTTKAMFAPASGFVKFKFHDGSAKHGVAELEGPARQTVFGLVFNQVVDIEFGGFVPNNFRDFQAEAKIQRSIVDLFEVQAVGLGRFILLKGNYGNDVVVGPTDIIKD